ncbi:hypothetical protein [Nocardia salmonicida]|uniref:hypothetical protein n=1 Tax=Nocardia salmonicida TaxID=53431 RepID=UPI0037B4F000
MTSWVPIGTSFRTTIWVQNLSEAELAALLWLLTLPEGAVFGIGLGKPLGFGSVTVNADLDTTRLHTHDQMRQRYRHLTGTPDASLRTPSARSPTASPNARTAPACARCASNSSSRLPVSADSRCTTRAWAEPTAPHPHPPRPATSGSSKTTNSRTRMPCPHSAATARLPFPT